MKVRLYKIGESYYLYTQANGLRRITRSAARHFLLNFSNSEYCEITAQSPGSMVEYEGDIIAELVDGNFLLIKNADLFRNLIESSEVTLVSVKQFAEMHGRSASMTRRHCQNGRIAGAILTPGGYVIPEDAGYPK